MTQPSARRDPYLDSWRGGFHLLMLVDHLPILFPGMLPLFAWVFECFGFVSVAEGFVFLSGYVTGLVYARVRREAGERALWQKAAIRAFVIYITYVVAVVLLLLLISFGGNAEVHWGGWRTLIELPVWRASLLAAGLTVQPSFLEILPMYSLFLLLTPLVIGQLERGRRWMVVLASAVIWFVEQLDSAGCFSVRWPAFGFFHVGGWQLIFVAGLLCGHKSQSASASWLPLGWPLALLVYSVAVFCFALRYDLFGIPLDPRWTARSILGPIRLLNFACVVFLVARFREIIQPRIAWRGLSFLSRHSLQVFAFHLVPVYIAALLFAQRMALPWTVQVLFVVLCLAGLFEIAWLAEATKQWFRRHRSGEAFRLRNQQAR